MASFGWKRKSGEKIIKVNREAFERESDVQEFREEEVADWLTLAPKQKVLILEDKYVKSKRLKEEGTVLAESERHWEAIKKWEEAIQLTPEDATLHEMKSQACLILNELYPAVAAAETAVQLQATWWPAHQTLGRAHLSLGEVRMAIKSFSRAIHLHPIDEELWTEDLGWAQTLLQKKQQIEAESQKHPSNKMDIKEIDKTKELELMPKDDCRQSIEQRQGLLDLHLLQMDNGPLVPPASALGPAKELKSLPANYVYMRD